MNKKKQSFEENLARLEEIVSEMEGGTAELDKLLSLFEEGVTLIKSCSSALDKAEQKVRLVKETGEVDFKKNPEED